ncbi:centrosome microtubule-binding domain of cep57 domain-containing protein [Sarocladium implicatum]|nr:centrosome microtubule-binding domain of cep57 domain-containing protein [Sarocladium implicatum]
MEVDATSRYRSRVLREMNANRENPFNSPPSSTGSHGTVTQTLSSVFSAPEGESTRKLNEEIARVTAPRNKLDVNWDAAHRKWPEFYSLPKGHEEDAFDDDTDMSMASKENKSPGVRFSREQNDDSTHNVWVNSHKTRAEMQPRVDNESDISSLIARSPIRHTLSLPGYGKNTRNSSPLAKVQTLDAADRALKSQRRSSLGDALDRLRKTSGQSNLARETREISPQMSSAKSSLTAVPSSPRSMGSPGQDASNVRSFFMPDVSHLGDFVTGTLRFSGSMRNGVPIFVKHGKVHDQRERPAAAAHAVVDSIEVPEDEEKIFVSMDMIRDEIISLQEHYDKVQEYAANLQDQVESLESQLKMRRSPSSGSHLAGAYEKLATQKQALEEEVTALRTRLEQASHKMSLHSTEKESLVQERDRAHRKLQEGCASIAKLTRKLSSREQELQESRDMLEASGKLRQSSDELGREITNLQHRRDELEIENANLQDENIVLREKVKELQDEMASVRMENSSMGKRIQSLLGDNRTLRNTQQVFTDDVNELQENLDDVLHELDAAREEIDNLRSQVKHSLEKQTTDRNTQRTAKQHSQKIVVEEETTTGLERTAHSLHDNTRKLKEKVKSIKKQMAQSRGALQDEMSAPLPEPVEKNMTSAYILPDITINTEDSGNTDTQEMPEPPELTEPENIMLGPYKVTDPSNIARNEASRAETDRKQSRSASRVRSKNSLRAQNALTTVTEMSFDDDVVEQQALPKSKSTSTVNGRHERRNSESRARSKAEKRSSTPAESYEEFSGLSDDESAIPEPTSPAKQFNVDTTLPSDIAQETIQHTVHSLRSQRARSQSRTRKTTRVNVDTTTGLAVNSCPTLSKDARRVLEELCEHDCKNCIVCTRIASHQGVITPVEAATGKKRVTISRPIPVTDRALPEDATMRPSQSPGHALAIVIKGLEDEARHLKHALAKLNAKYTSADQAIGRGKRLAMAEAIHTLLRQLEVKNDQIYSLYDVLEGQKAAGQAMTEEDIEMTVLNITGMTVGDVTSHSQQFTWEGFADS